MCRISNLTCYLPLNPFPVSPPLPSSLVALVLHPPSRSAATQKRGIKEERRWISSACFARSSTCGMICRREPFLRLVSVVVALSRLLCPSVRPPSSIAKRSEAWPGGRRRRRGGHRDRTSLCGLSDPLSPWTTNQGGTSERARVTARPPRGVGRSDMKFGKRKPTALVSPTVVCFCAGKEEGERRRWPTGKDVGRRGDARDRWRSRRGQPLALTARGPSSSEMLPHPAHNVLPKLFQSLITTFESLEQVQSTLHGGDPQLVSWPSYVHPIPHHPWPSFPCRIKGMHE